MLTAHTPNERATAPLTILGHIYQPGQFIPFYVPRPAMPQIDEGNLPELVALAFQAGHNPLFHVASARDLRAHQKVDEHRVRSMPEALLYKPILVSADLYVLDGNHRWHAHIHQGRFDTPVIEIGLPFEEAIDWLLGLPFTYTLKPDTPERN